MCADFPAGAALNNGRPAKEVAGRPFLRLQTLIAFPRFAAESDFF